MNYYNENNPDAAAWLRELIRAGHIAPGFVDERSIVDVKANELGQYTQCHFFAGIGGWSLALRLAGWPDERQVWTGSCPCQPFSVAGKKQVDKDERNLWPAFRAAIAICKPAIVFGEQVASKDGRIWLAGIRTDLEALGYGFGAADLCAAGISAPMVSQRLHWLAANDRGRWTGKKLSVRQSRQNKTALVTVGNGKSNVGSSSARMAPAMCEQAHVKYGTGGRLSGQQRPALDSGPQTARSQNGETGNNDDSRHREVSGVAKANRYHEHWWSGPLQVGWNCIEGEIERGGRKYRAQWRTKPGLSLLADGIPGRVAQLCGFGNAIVPQLAATFVQACDDVISANA